MWGVWGQRVCQPTGRTPHASAMVLTARWIQSRSSASGMPLALSQRYPWHEISKPRAMASRPSHGDSATASAQALTVHVAPYFSSTRTIRQ